MARLDIKAPDVIKGVRMDGLRKVGRPMDLSRKYYDAGIDELLFVDVVASLYERQAMMSLLRSASEEFFVPITVVGGIRSISDAREAFAAGADKVGVNTSAIRNPRILSDLSNEFGSQAVVLSVEAKRSGQDAWECYVEGGREPTGVQVEDWVHRAEGLGAGEVLISSVDCDGTKQGADLQLCQMVTRTTSLPVVVGSGLASLDQIEDVLSTSSVSGFFCGRALHDETLSIPQLRTQLQQKGHCVREVRCG